MNLTGEFISRGEIIALISILQSLAARGHSDQMSSSDSIECVCVEL